MITKRPESWIASLALSSVCLSLLCPVARVLAEDAASATSALVYLDGTVAAQANPIGEDGRIRSVAKPVLRLLRTKSATPKGTMLVFPGGGYNILAIGHEGFATAEFLNKQGLDVAILDYTIASGNGTRDRALEDALAAWRLIKSRAKVLGLHDKRFGVMGYSAGGHLAARLTSKLPAAEQPDDVGLIYPAYLQETASGASVRSVMPPPSPRARLFALIAANDKSEWVTSCSDYAAVWKANGGEARLEILKDGGHGFGMRAELPGDSKQWPDLFAGFLQGAPAAKPQATTITP